MADLLKEGIIRVVNNNFKDELLMSVCHDLKAPLQTMLGFNAINNDKLNETIFSNVNPQDENALRTVEQINRNMDIIAKEGTRLTSMIENLLDMYCLEQDEVVYNIEPCNVQDLIEEIADLLKIGCDGKELNYRIEYKKELPLVMVDRYWIVRVLENLISNAIKFTQKGYVKISVTSQEAKVKFVIEDTGTGIPPHIKNRIFEKFVKASIKDTQKGSGLGLAISKNIVKKHGGEIYFESQEGKGSKFSFTVLTDK